jgi:hypothetical protein
MTGGARRAATVAVQSVCLLLRCGLEHGSTRDRLGIDDCQLNRVFPHV